MTRASSHNHRMHWKLQTNHKQKGFAPRKGARQAHTNAGRLLRRRSHPNTMLTVVQTLLLVPIFLTPLAATQAQVLVPTLGRPFVNPNNNPEIQGSKELAQRFAPGRQHSRRHDPCRRNTHCHQHRPRLPRLHPDVTFNAKRLYRITTSALPRKPPLPAIATISCEFARTSQAGPHETEARASQPPD